MGANKLFAHIILFPGLITCGVDLTVIVKVTGRPIQLPRVGRTSNSLVVGKGVKLLAISVLICPLLLAGNPLLVLLFVQI